MAETALKNEKPARTIEREPGLFVTDEELPRLLGIPREQVRATLSELDRRPQSGFPKKDKMWGDRRYWPAVKAWFDRRYRGIMAPPPPQRGSPNDR